MKYILFSLILFSCSFQNKEIQKINNKSTDYQTLINLFYEWREFENPPLLNGAPDYTKERFKKNEKNFKDLQNRLNQISIDNWSVPQQIDWHIVRAEMNGYDFNYKILQPWVRDPQELIPQKSKLLLIMILKLLFSKQQITELLGMPLMLFLG